MLTLQEFMQRLWFPRIFALEWIVLAAAFVIFLVLPERLRWLRPLTKAWNSAATHRQLSILLPILTVLVGRALLLPVLGIPAPCGPDEFGYLLTADTFAHGRLTNPTSPVWPSFETSHVFHVPTYQSHFPIGYPVLLAAAQKLLGQPWVAVYLVTALFAGIVTWMLQAWVSPKWALLGGLLVALRIGLFSYWMNSYFGGSLPALGGCLLLGCVPRIVPGLGRRNAGRPERLTLYFALGAIGLIILANTRPFDGAVFALPIVLWTAHSLFAPGAPWRRRAALAVVPALALFIAAEAGVAYYNYRVTGSALRMPALVSNDQYGVAAPFLFQDLKPVPRYNHWEFYVIHAAFEAGTFREQKFGLLHSPAVYLATLRYRANFYGHFYIGPLLTFPLLFALPTIRGRKLRLAWIVLGFEVLLTLLESWVQVHYIAPLTGVIVLLLMWGMRRMAAFRIGRFRAGIRMVRALPAVCLILLAVRVAAFDQDTYQRTEARSLPPELTWAFSYYRNYHRDQLENSLKTIPGKHLVIVHLQRSHFNYLLDKVYNGADLENAPILWARSMDTSNNCRLAQHYPGRTLWMVDDWNNDQADWRDSLRPRRVKAEELCSSTWALDLRTRDEVWVPLRLVDFSQRSEAGRTNWGFSKP